MVGGDVYDETVKSLAPGGQLIIYGCASGIQGTIHPEYFVDENLSQIGFNLEVLIKNDLVRGSKKYQREELYFLRANLVKAIDPLQSKGAVLQEILLHCNSMAMGQALNKG